LAAQILTLKTITTMANNTGSIIAALLGGALVGAMAALLFAPKSGQELRDDVVRIAKEKASHLNKEELEELVNNVIARVREYFTKEEIEEEVDKAIAEAAPQPVKAKA
jgi:gas vesicle protein